MAVFTQVLDHAGDAIEWGLGILLIDELHEFFVVGTILLGNIVEAAPADIQKFALTFYAQTVMRINL
jgi:hypothetical protein